MVDAAIVAEVGAETKDYEWSLSTVRALEIKVPADFDLASDLAKDARTNWKRLDERRTAITKPLLASKAQVDALFKPALSALKAIEDELKAKIGAYTSAPREAAREAMAESAEQYAAGETPTAIIPEAPHAKGVSVTEYWDFEVTDPALVPREYCSPDPAKIKAGIWYANTPKTPPRPIPGVTFALKTQTVVRVK